VVVHWTETLSGKKKPHSNTDKKTTKSQKAHRDPDLGSDDCKNKQNKKKKKNKENKELSTKKG